MSLIQAIQVLGRALQQDGPKQRQGTVPQALALLKMSENGAHTMGAVGKAAGVSTAAATGIIDRLEQLGLAQRSHDPKDRRMIYAELTEKGRAVAEEVWLA